MKNKNCPNCGAVYDVAQGKCPYCGTTYLDIGCIDFDNREPIYIRIKMNGHYVLQRVIPMLGNINFQRNTFDITDKYGTVLKQITRDTICETEITFSAIPDKDGCMYKVVM